MNVHEMVAYCGLTCQGCPIYWATREEDLEKKQKMRAAIVRLGQEHYGMEMRPEEITDCDGCRSENGRLYPGCKKCEIRACARQRKVETCAHCPDYACEKLQKSFVTEPSSKIKLDVIRSMI
ncbi:MAG TPA: DUF3795 domain-containing protein [Thermoguttaceae bacterium]